MSQVPVPAAPAREKFRLSRLVFAIPLLGGMLREVAHHPERALPGFILNIVLALVLASLVFGFGVVMAVYLVLAPAVLALIMLMSADFGRSL